MAQDVMCAAMAGMADAMRGQCNVRRCLPWSVDAVPWYSLLFEVQLQFRKLLILFRFHIYSAVEINIYS